MSFIGASEALGAAARADGADGALLHPRSVTTKRVKADDLQKASPRDIRFAYTIAGEHRKVTPRRPCAHEGDRAGLDLDRGETTRQRTLETVRSWLLAIVRAHSMPT